MEDENNLKQRDPKDKKGNVVVNKKDMTPEEKKLYLKKEIMSWVMVVLVGVALAFVINYLVIIKAEVPTGSMEKTIMIDDRILGNRLAYLFSKPKRGDIVVFDRIDDPAHFVKRIIGEPLDTITIREGKIYINDSMEPLDEPYLLEPMVALSDEQVFHVPEDCYFMMGDNRNISKDSRAWDKPYINRNKILAKAVLRYSPSIGFIK